LGGGINSTLFTVTGALPTRTTVERRVQEQFAEALQFFIREAES